MTQNERKDKALINKLELDKLEYYGKKDCWKEYCQYKMKQFYSLILHKNYIPVYKHYAGKRVLGFRECNKAISEAIRNREPYWVGRYGGNEMNIIVETLRYYKHLPNQRERALENLCTGAGFFPNNIESCDKFVEKMIECSRDLDLHAIWPMSMEDYIIRYFEKENVQLTRLGYLEPWNKYRYGNKEEDMEFWTAALEGKKVLVVHPFTDSIVKQYKEKRRELFSKVVLNADEILPQFDLIPVKAVQTCAGQRDERFASWFEALDYMRNICQKKDFDVAIIGCGAYGFPLAWSIKKMGKVAIHLGGATQLMLGIRGKRWDTEDFNRYVANASWIRPVSSERPAGLNRVEEGCYW